MGNATPTVPADILELYEGIAGPLDRMTSASSPSSMDRMKPQPTAPVPRVALTREEAASALGMSLDSFERHVQPELRLIRRGKLRLVPVRELERWADVAAERVPR